MHTHNDIWFPAKESDKVVGRFIEVLVDDPVASTKAGHKVTMTYTVLEHKVAGSNDVSTDVVKPFKKAELTARFPGAWEHYEKLKALPPAPPQPTIVDLGIKGTPVEEAAIFNHDKLSWLKAQGIYTIEQVAGLSDSTCQNLGSGAKAWRKKAKEYLSAKRQDGQHAASA